MIPAFIIAGMAGAAIAKTLNKDEIFYSTKNVSELIGVSEYTVRKKIRDGEIKAEVIPGKAGYRVSKSDLEEYLNRKKVSATEKGETNTGIFGTLIEQIGKAFLDNPDVESLNPELLKSIIEGKQLDLKGLKLRLQRLALDDDGSNDFKKKKLDLEIAINDLESAIQAYQITKNAIKDLKNSQNTK